MIHRHRRILGEAAWIAVGCGLSAVLQLIGTRAVTQFVPVHVFGTISLLLGIVAFQRQLVLFPLSQAIYRFYADVGHTGELPLLRRVAGRATIQVAGLSGLVFLVGSSAYCIAQKISLLIPVLLSTIYLLDAWRVPQSQILLASGRQRANTLLSLLDSAVRPALTVIVVLWLGASTINVLLSYFFTMFIVAGATHFTRDGHATVHAPGPEDAPLRRRMFRFGLPLAPLAIVGWITNLSDRYVIEFFLGSSAVGTYAAVYSLSSQPALMIHALLAFSLLPRYNAAASRGNHSAVTRIMGVRLALSVILCLIIVVLVYLLRDWIVRWFVGPEYRSGARLMPWITAGYACWLVANVFETVFLAYKKSGWMLLIQCIGAAACIPVQIFMTKQYGLDGAAMAVPIYFGIQLIAAVTLYFMMFKKLTTSEDAATEAKQPSSA